nr:glycosyltransferase family 4 protein [Bacteriovorax sp. HI3]
MNSKPKAYRPVLVLAPGVLAGAEKVVLTGLAALSAIGLNPLMVIIRETRIPHLAHDFEKIIPSHIDYRIIDSTKALDIELPKRLRESLQDQTLPLILHSHGFKALIACYMSKGKHPHIHTHHGNTAHTFKVRIYEKIAMMTMKSCRVVVAVSYKMKDELEKSLRPFNRIVVIENMLSLKNAAKIRSERKNLVTESEIIKLIYVGRISPEKGLLPFLTAWSMTPERKRFHLTVLGDGVDRAAAEAFARDNGLLEQITFHGFVSDPSSYFTSPDILIMPSLREGLPMTLIEALASGVPVIANNVGAIASMVTHNHNGFFAEDFSPESWVKVLEATLQNVSRWKKQAESEAQGIEERFSADSWAQKTRELYQKEINS